MEVEFHGVLLDVLWDEDIVQLRVFDYSNLLTESQVELDRV